MATGSVGMGGMIDVNTIVSQLMSIERQPLSLITSRIKGIDTKLSEIGKLKSSMDALRSASVALSGAGAWSAAKATSAKPEAIDAKAAGGALSGSYSLSVQKLAQHQTVVTGPVANADALVGGGTMTITFGAGDGAAFTPDATREPLSVTVPAGATMAQVRDAINRTGGDVGASLVTDAAGTRLMVRSGESGEAQAFRIDVADDGSGAGGLGLASLAYAPGAAGGAVTRIQAASNAEIELNGLALSVPSNQASNLIENVTFSFREVTAAPVQIEIANDAEAVKAEVDAFVTAYNELNGFIRAKTMYDAGTQTAGPLQGNRTVTMLQSRMRSIVGSSVDGLDLGRLSDAGIQIQRDGSLKVDDGKLGLAVADPSKLESLFGERPAAGQGGGGIARQLKSMLDDMLGIDGAITGATESLKSRREIYESREDRLNNRLTMIESRLIRQYSALDASLAQLSGSMNAVSNIPTEW